MSDFEAENTGFVSDSHRNWNIGPVLILEALDKNFKKLKHVETNNWTFKKKKTSTTKVV